MSIAAKLGGGSYFTYDGTRCYDITKINSIPIENGEEDVTDLDSTGKEFIAKLRDFGSFDIEGNYLGNGDAGQSKIETDANATTVPIRTWKVNLTNVNKEITGSGYVKNLTFGESTPDGKIPFKATIRISGKPSMSAPVLTGLTIVLSDGTITPTFAATKFNYVAITTAATVTVTPTLAGATFIVTANGTSQAVLTGQASSAITMNQGSTTEITIKATLTSSGLSSIYTINCADLA